MLDSERGSVVQNNQAMCKLNMKREVIQRHTSAGNGLMVDSFELLVGTSHRGQRYAKHEGLWQRALHESCGVLNFYSSLCGSQ